MKQKWPILIFSALLTAFIVLAGIWGNAQFEPLHSGSVLIDGSSVGEIGDAVLKDRKQLSEDGLFTVVIPLKKKTGELIGQPEIISRGFVYVKSSEELIADAKNLVKGLAAQFASANRSEWSGIKNNIRSALKNELYHKTKRTPIILPIIIEIDI